MKRNNPWITAILTIGGIALVLYIMYRVFMKKAKDFHFADTSDYIELYNDCPEMWDNHSENCNKSLI